MSHEVREVQVTFDCADPAGLAGFWAEALGYVLQPPPPGFDSWDAALDAWGVPADHQTGNEDGENDEQEDAVKTGADAAEDHFAEHDVDERHEAAKRRE